MPHDVPELTNVEPEGSPANPIMGWAEARVTPGRIGGRRGEADGFACRLRHETVPVKGHRSPREPGSDVDAVLPPTWGQRTYLDRSEATLCRGIPLRTDQTRDSPLANRDSGPPLAAPPVV